MEVKTNGVPLRRKDVSRYSIAELERIVKEEYPNEWTSHGTRAPTAEQLQAALTHGLKAIRLIQAEVKQPGACRDDISKLDAQLGQEMLDMFGEVAHLAFAVITAPFERTLHFGVLYPEA